MKGGQNHDVLLENTDLRNELKTCLREIVVREKRELTPHLDYKRVWSSYVKEEWSRMFTPESREWDCTLSERAPGFVSEIFELCSGILDLRGVLFRAP